MKKFITLLFIGIVILFSSCTERVNISELSKSELSKFRDIVDDLPKNNEPKYVYNGDPFTGIIFGEEDQMTFEVTFKDGLLNGSNEIYDENGQLRYGFIFYNGLKDGEWVEYYENGQLKSKQNFDKGDKGGIWVSYSNNGQLKLKETYNKGCLISWEDYYENGQLYRKVSRKGLDEDGDCSETLDGPYEEYLEDGKLVEKGLYEDGKRTNGTVNTYNTNGQLELKFESENGSWVMEEYYESGKLKNRVTSRSDISSHELYYENGLLKEKTKTEYKDGKILKSFYEEYYSNGQLKRKGDYQDVKGNELYQGYGNGPFEEYYENGQLKKKINYKDERLDGPYEEYNEEGEIIRKGTYIDGFFNGIFNEENDILETYNISENNVSNPSEKHVSGKYPKSSTKYLKQDELNGMSLEELVIMRNEIFARHGLRFPNGGKMDTYFSDQEWYSPQINNVDRKLTPLEKSNIDLIKEEENKISSTKTSPEEDLDVDFKIVENVPVFPGCEGATNKRSCFNEMIQKHIGKNFHYPEIAQEMGVQGRVSVMFVIQKDGSIGNIRMRGPDNNLEAEASRIIGKLPKMTPGNHKGKPVNVPFSIPITFKLQ